MELHLMCTGLLVFHEQAKGAIPFPSVRLLHVLAPNCEHHARHGMDRHYARLKAHYGTRIRDERGRVVPYVNLDDRSLEILRHDSPGINPTAPGASQLPNLATRTGGQVVGDALGRWSDSRMPLSRLVIAHGHFCGEHAGAVFRFDGESKEIPHEVFWLAEAIPSDGSDPSDPHLKLVVKRRGGLPDLTFLATPNRRDEIWLEYSYAPDPPPQTPDDPVDFRVAHYDALYDLFAPVSPADRELPVCKGLKADPRPPQCASRFPVTRHPALHLESLAGAPPNVFKRTSAEPVTCVGGGGGFG